MSRFEHDAVAALFVSGALVLLCHRHPRRQWLPNVWDVPGGHVQEGESPDAALVREVSEELGVRIRIHGFAPFRTIEQGSQLRLRAWVVTHWNGQIVNRAPDEHDDIGWFSAEEIDGLELADPRLGDLLRGALAEEAAASGGGLTPG